MTSKNLFTRLYMISYQYDTYIYIYDSILDKIIYIILCIYKLSYRIFSAQPMGFSPLTRASWPSTAPVP